jgi:hypothetical protein
MQVSRECERVIRRAFLGRSYFWRPDRAGARDAKVHAARYRNLLVGQPIRLLTADQAAIRGQTAEAVLSTSLAEVIAARGQLGADLLSRRCG